MMEGAGVPFIGRSVRGVPWVLPASGEVKLGPERYRLFGGTCGNSQDMLRRVHLAQA